MALQLESTSSSQSAKVIRHFLNECASGVLATTDANGQPHAAVVYFFLQDDFSLLFGTKTGTRKYKNTQENNRAAFVVYDEQQQTTVQMNGQIETVEDSEMKQSILNRMFTSAAKHSATEIPPADKLYAGDYTVLRFVPETMRMAVYARPNAEGDDDLFETLTFSNKESSV